METRIWKRCLKSLSLKKLALVAVVSTRTSRTRVGTFLDRAFHESQRSLAQEQANDPEISLDEIIREHHRVEYDLYVVKSEYLEEEPEDFASKMYRAEEFPSEHGWHTDWKSLCSHPSTLNYPNR